jgi:sporulation protein YlmC with PRC-barrel domain
MKNLALVAASLAFMAAPVYAQTAAPTATDGTMTEGTSADGAMATPMTDGSGGMTMGTTSTVALKFVEISDADVMASKLDDLNVYNNENEEIGEIQDLVIKDGKTISGVVVSVGGFLGLGERYVLLDPSSIVLGTDGDDMKAFVNTSKEELTNAPEFSYDDKK